MEDGLERVGRRFAGLERDAEVLRGVDYELEQLAGEAGEVVCRIAQHRGAGEIVIGTRGVGRIAGLLGSVAHDVLHRADRPVTVIPKRMVREPAPAAPTPA
jgi:nucleotide-binding universal stress UspA family protein